MHIISETLLMVITVRFSVGCSSL